MEKRLEEQFSPIRKNEDPKVAWLSLLGGGLRHGLFAALELKGWFWLIAVKHCNSFSFIRSPLHEGQSYLLAPSRPVL